MVKLSVLFSVLLFATDNTAEVELTIVGNEYSFSGLVLHQDRMHDSELGYQKVVDIGTENSRETPEAIALGGTERYRAVGAIICPYTDKYTGKKKLARHTATLVENRFTLATDRHSFVYDDGTPKVNREDCRFNVYDINGEIVDSASVRRIRVDASGTTNENISGRNSPNDWAVVILETSIAAAVPFRVAPQGVSLTVNDRIQICSFSGDLKTEDNSIGDYQKRCLNGKYRDNGVADPGLGNPMTMIHDIPTGVMSSGAAVFVDHDPARSPVLYAIHVGGGLWDEASKSYTCRSKDKSYHVTLCSNHANFLTDAFYKTLDTAIKDTGGSN